MYAPSFKPCKQREREESAASLLKRFIFLFFFFILSHSFRHSASFRFWLNKHRRVWSKTSGSVSRRRRTLLPGTMRLFLRNVCSFVPRRENQRPNSPGRTCAREIYVTKHTLQVTAKYCSNSGKMHVEHFTPLDTRAHREPTCGHWVYILHRKYDQISGGCNRIAPVSYTKKIKNATWLHSVDLRAGAHF
jgi:hypothetical protein